MPMRDNKKLLGCLLITASVASAAVANASESKTVTYICIEERSVGWEERDNGELAVGKFKPDEKRFFVRFTPHRLEGVGSERVVALPFIEVTKAGKTYTFQSSACDLVARREMPDSLTMRNTRCEDALARGVDNHHFGTSMSSYGFFPSLAKAPKTASYLESKPFGLLVAYLSAGTCVLED